MGTMMSMPDVPRTADESETLLGLLDEQRALVLWKLDGIADDLARSSTVASGTTLLGIVKHLAWVERSFFAGDMGDIDVPYPWTAQDPDADWNIDHSDTVASVSALYLEAVAESRAVIAGMDLGAVGGSAENPVSLRFVLGHMIAETARHLGHMDILREQLDGATGYTPD